MTYFKDITLLLARLGLGVVLIAHGWQKLSTFGMDQTTATFEDWGVPLPAVSAYYSMIVELFGGFALVIGLTVRFVGVLVLLDMAGAIAIVHATNGVFVDDGGFELALSIGLIALLLTAYGGGAISLDRLFRRGSPEAADESPAS